MSAGEKNRCQFIQEQRPIVGLTELNLGSNVMRSFYIGDCGIVVVVIIF